jgi:hypothetical protein
MWVEKFDATGVREQRPVRDDRYVDVGPISPGMAGIWAKLPMVDGAAFDTRLDEIADTVCPDDPRTRRQCRADAMVAMAAGQTRLECGSGEDCAAAAPQQALAQVAVQVIAEQASLDGSSENPRFVRCRDLTCRFPGCDARAGRNRPAKPVPFRHRVASR